jgi:fatty-acyl-CoA synthase
MLGRMQDWPLLMHKVIDFAAIQFPEQQVASRTVEGPMHYTNYRAVRQRALKVAKRLERDGIKLGDRVATLAWNGYRHLETWYGIVGAGAVYHTVNPRLFPEQIAWIMNDAEDRAVFVDLTFVPLVEAIADRLPTIERYIVLTDGAHMPATKLKNAVAYEDWIGEVDDDFAWQEFDERTAAGLCYTSGTTGNPKGVLYSHRSNLLHSMMASTSACLTVTSDDAVLPVVPMFHANSWGLALSCPMRGASMVMPGPRLDGASVFDLLETEKVTMTAAVPTVWLGLLQYLRKENKKPTTLKFVGIGGSACPPDMIRAFQEDYGVTVRHAWGMTEMSPVGSAGALKPR